MKNSRLVDIMILMLISMISIQSYCTTENQTSQRSNPCTLMLKIGILRKISHQVLVSVVIVGLLLGSILNQESLFLLVILT